MKLMLGTVQFGLDYGISNKTGQTATDHVSRILEKALDEGVTFLDTAKAYGNCEEVLGKNKRIISNFNIVSKVSGSGDIKTDVIDSIKRLGVERLYGILLHNSDVLCSDNSGEIQEKLLKLKEEGLVSKVGVSVYSEKEIDIILEKGFVDIIQLPVNIFDQRLVKSGTLKKVKEKEIEIHGRSLFLQGLFFLKPDELNEFFNPVKPSLEEINKVTKNDVFKKISLLLNFAKEVNELDRIVIGVTKLKEFEEVLSAYKNELQFEYDKFSQTNEDILNPSNWPR